MLDLTNYKQVRDLLKHFKVWKKKRLGQHFLVNKNVLNKIIEVSKIQKGEYITEIGAGHGVLTVELLKNGALVDTVEIDDDMLPILNFTTKNYRDQLEVHHQHILGYQQKNFPYKVVANIPYQLTSPILRKFLPETDNPPKSMTILMQKEVAERICNQKKKSILSLIVSAFGKAEIVEIVPEDAFFPPPKVKSAILHIDIFDKPKIKIKRKKFYTMVKMGFGSPRKMLKNVLSGAFRKPISEIEKIMEQHNIPLNSRAENLEIKDWENLAKELISGAL